MVTVAAAVTVNEVDAESARLSVTVTVREPP